MGNNQPLQHNPAFTAFDQAKWDSDVNKIFDAIEKNSVLDETPEISDEPIEGETLLNFLPAEIKDMFARFVYTTSLRAFINLWRFADMRGIMESCTVPNLNTSRTEILTEIARRYFAGGNVAAAKHALSLIRDITQRQESKAKILGERFANPENFDSVQVTLFCLENPQYVANEINAGKLSKSTINDSFCGAYECDVETRSIACYMHREDLEELRELLRKTERRPSLGGYLHICCCDDTVKYGYRSFIRMSEITVCSKCLPARGDKGPISRPPALLAYYLEVHDPIMKSPYVVRLGCENMHIVMGLQTL